MKTANDLQIKPFRNKWRYLKLDLWNVHAKCNSKQNDGAWLKLWCGPKEYDANERSYKTDILHRYNGWIVNQLWGIHKQYSVKLIEWQQKCSYRCIGNEVPSIGYFALNTGQKRWKNENRKQIECCWEKFEICNPI